MNIAETIYQHVKTMPRSKAVEVLHFVESLETKPDEIVKDSQDKESRAVIRSVPHGPRSDTEINNDFQVLRDEWN
jgi:hypothetical protein